MVSEEQLDDLAYLLAPILDAVVPVEEQLPCKRHGCKGDVFGRGLCSKHYFRERRESARFGNVKR